MIVLILLTGADQGVYAPWIQGRQISTDGLRIFATNYQSVLICDGNGIVLNNSLKFDGSQLTVPVKDGVLVGGSFLSQWSPDNELFNPLLSINYNGLIDKSFLPRVFGFIKAVVKVGDVIYIGGQFDYVVGKNGFFARTALAAIDLDGNILPLDAQIMATYSYQTIVNDMKYANGLLYIVGEFISVLGVTRNRAAAIDLGTFTLSAFDPDFGIAGSNQVVRVITTGSNVFITGNFTVLNNGAVARSYVAKVDALTGVADPTWDLGITGLPNITCYATTDGTYLYVAGEITGCSAGARTGFIKASVASPSVIDPIAPSFTLSGASAITLSLLYYNGVIYLSGNFDTVNGSARQFTAAIDATTGALLPWVVALDWTYGFGKIELFDHGGYIYGLSGNYNLTSIPGRPTSGVLDIYRIDPVTGAVDTSFKPNPSYGPESMAFSLDRMYVGGAFANWYNNDSAPGLMEFLYSPPTLLGIPATPVVEFLNRRRQDGRPPRTLFKWKAVTKDVYGQIVEVLGYRVYRTESLNTEDPALIAEITSVDFKGFIDTMFTEEVDGFHKYCVTAFNRVGESEKACAVFVDSVQADRV